MADATMGNQQGKTNVELAWLAGFIDGEGSFMVCKLAGKRLKRLAEDKKAVYFNPAFKIAGTCYETLPQIVEILERLELPFHISNRTAIKANHKDSWMIEVRGFKRCKLWCAILIPYLKTKKVEAEAMLKFCESRTKGYVKGQNNERPLSPEDLQCIEVLRGRRILHRLNAEVA